MRKSTLKCLVGAAVCWAGAGAAMAEAYYAVVSNVSWQVQSESDPVTGSLEIGYAPGADGRVVVRIDGEAVVDSGTEGAYTWQPQSLGEHTLSVDGDVDFSATYTVTALDYDT